MTCTRLQLSSICHKSVESGVFLLFGKNYWRYTMIHPFWFTGWTMIINGQWWLNMVYNPSLMPYFRGGWGHWATLGDSHQLDPGTSTCRTKSDFSWVAERMGRVARPGYRFFMFSKKKQKQKMAQQVNILSGYRNIKLFLLLKVKKTEETTCCCETVKRSGLTMTWHPVWRKITNLKLQQVIQWSRIPGTRTYIYLDENH